MRRSAGSDEETCVVVLAGGLSKRFGGDKLSVTYRGERVVSHVCHAASAVAGNVYLSGRGRARMESLMRFAPGLVAGSIIDSDRRCVGPTRGMVTASRETGCARLLFLPGDMPRLEAGLLRRFLSLSPAGAASSIVWGAGMVESLIQVHGGRGARVLAEKVARVRGNLARPTDLLRGASRLQLVHARHLTRNPFALSNLNSRSDLESPRPRGDFEGCVSEDVHFSGRPSGLFWEAAEAATEGNHGRASELFELEGCLYSAMGIHHLGGHCLTDASSSARMHGDRFRAAALSEAARVSLARMKTVRPLR